MINLNTCSTCGNILCKTCGHCKKAKCLSEPSKGLLMSMSLRYDPSLALPDKGSENKSRRDRLTTIIAVARQFYEEISGRGFYNLDKEGQYADIYDQIMTNCQENSQICR